MIKVDVKPMSVNEAWQGKRFKTPKYNMYSKVVTLMLPALKLPSPPYQISFEFGFSNVCSDWDNPVKPLQDIMQKKYKFNDKDVMRAIVEKKIVPKGKEYFKFKIESYETI